jgi:hypothetical protein
MFALDFTDGSVGISVKEHPEFVVDGVQVLLRPRELFQAAAKLRILASRVEAHTVRREVGLDD